MKEVMEEHRVLWFKEVQTIATQMEFILNDHKRRLLSFFFSLYTLGVPSFKRWSVFPSSINQGSQNNRVSKIYTDIRYYFDIYLKAS